MSEYKNRYKWLRLINLYTGKLYANRDPMDELADYAPGWNLAFGHLLCEELDKAIKKANVEDTFVVFQIKEKFGILKIYHNQPRNSEIDLICRKFSTISQFVCIRCGRLDVPMVFSAWIRPMDRECYIKTEHLSEDNGEYDEFTKGSKSEIPDKMCWEEFERYDKETNTTHYQKFEVDISDTVKKIREHWEERVANGAHIVEKSKLDRTYSAEEVFKMLEEKIKEAKEDVRDDNE